MTEIQVQLPAETKEASPEPAAIYELTPKVRFDIAREIVRHEDGLVNSRVTWLQVFQGFLFTAFFSGIGLLKDDTFWKTHSTWRDNLVIALAILCILGMFSSLAAFFSVRSATLQLEEVATWWKKSGFKDEFPPLTGGHGIKIPFTEKKILGADILLVFLSIWIAFLILFLRSVIW